MKFYYLFSILLVVLYTTNANIIKRANNKRDDYEIVEYIDAVEYDDGSEKSDECQYINSMFGEDESFNCCGYYDSSYRLNLEIVCENGHITKM